MSVKRNLVWLLSPAFVVLAVLVVLPTIVTIGAAFSRWQLTDLAHPSFTGLSNFAHLLGTPAGVQTILNTIYLMLLSVPAEAALGVGLALLLRRNSRWNRVWRTALLLPTMATPVAMALVWSLMLNPQLGIIDIVIRALGGPTILWTSDKQLALVTLAIVDIWQWTPFIATIVVAGLQSIDHGLIEAALIDGASPWIITKSILLPQVAGVIMSAIVLRLVDSLQTFDTVFVITSGGPGIASQTLNFLGYEQLFQGYSIGYASTSAVALFVIILIAVGIARALQRKAEALA